jgi:hypothetical protein
MNGKVIRLVVGAAVLVGGAALMMSRGGEGSAESREVQPFLASLKSDASKVERVELHRGDDSVELVRSGDSWTVASAGGYPAKLDAVRGIVGGLASLTIDEPLTAKRERHAEIGLAWPDATKQATLVRLLGASDVVLHEVVLGEEKWEPKSQYVRKLREDQTYRCRGGVTVDTALRGFVDAEIVTLDTAEIESINYDGVILSRGEDGAWTCELAPGPVADGAWSEEQRKAAAQALPGWLSRVELENVRRRDREGATWTPDPALSVTYFAKRATITVEGMKDGDALWVRLSAKPVDAPVAAPTDAPTTAPPASATFDWAAWERRVAPWEFKLPEWKLAALKRIREAKPAPAAPPTG